MKKNGFTLIELLVVVVVLATLMGIVFRLAGLGDDSKKRSTTIQRIQRLENALSGYYAAFGSYPPVPVHGSRSIYARVNSSGIPIRSSGGGGGSSTPGGLGSAAFEENLASLDANNSEIVEQVEAACRSQPIAVRFPYRGDKGELIAKAIADLATERIAENNNDYVKRQAVFQSGFDALEKNPGRFAGELVNHDWCDIQLFQFGLLSFLLPRYLFMLDGDASYYDQPGGQWDRNNSMLAKANGQPFASWSAVKSALGMNYSGSSSSGGSGMPEECFTVSNKLSQAVCARWMQNFEGAISGGREFYGVDTVAKDDFEIGGDINLSAGSKVMIYTVGPASVSGGSQGYILDGMSMKDGWGEELYYYSPTPYQTYRVWSSGPNKLTFPPWIELKSLSGDDRTAAAYWIMDDIVQMSN